MDKAEKQMYEKVREIISNQLDNKYIIYLTYVVRSGMLYGQAISKETNKAYAFSSSNKITVSNKEAIANIMVRMILKAVDNDEVL